jgi:hypothetical protein
VAGGAFSWRTPSTFLTLPTNQGGRFRAGAAIVFQPGVVFAII